MSRCFTLHVLAERDGWTCAYCGLAVMCVHSAPEPAQDPFGEPGETFIPAMPAQIEHVIPRARGGSEGLDNLVLACAACNREKGVTMPCAAFLDVVAVPA